MATNYDFIIIGGGSAGLVVASGAAGLGAKVALVEKHKMGGDCLNYGCVPSKAFLAAARTAKSIKDANVFGLDASCEPINMSQVKAYVTSIIKEIEPHDSVERFESLGVDVFQGAAKIKDKTTVSVEMPDKKEPLNLKGKRLVIATGSSATIPPISGLSDVDFLTNESVFELESLPKHIIILGAGPIGLELGQGFRYLGSEVTVVDKIDTLFPNDDPEVGPLMKTVMEGNGLSLKLGASIQSVTQKNGMKLVTIVNKDGKQEIIEGEQVLVSLGRKPHTQNLGLENVGVTVDKRGYIPCNSSMQTKCSSVFACGDVAGPFQFTHSASYQAGIILKKTIFKMPAKAEYSAFPWVTYTQPEVAHVGLTEQQAQKQGLFVSHEIVKLASIDRAKADHDRHGFLKLILGKKNRIVGVTIVGKKAGEMISLGTLAIQQKLKPMAFMKMVFPYPVQSEIYKFAAFGVARRSLKPWMKSLIKVLLRL